MARDRLKGKGRRDSGRFAQIPDNVLRSEEFHRINGEATRLLMALAVQYNGHNNGDLSAAMAVVKNYGFTSSGTLSNNLKALVSVGLIIRTRDGLFMRGQGTCALFALAWKPIDECPGKHLDVGPTAIPLRTFRPAHAANRPVLKPDRDRSENRSDILQ